MEDALDAYFDTAGASNSHETINGIIEQTERTARGYRNPQLPTPNARRGARHSTHLN